MGRREVGNVIIHRNVFCFISIRFLLNILQCRGEQIYFTVNQKEDRLSFGLEEESTLNKSIKREKKFLLFYFILFLYLFFPGRRNHNVFWNKRKIGGCSFPPPNFFFFSNGLFGMCDARSDIQNIDHYHSSDPFSCSRVVEVVVAKWTCNFVLMLMMMTKHHLSFLFSFSGVHHHLHLPRGFHYLFPRSRTK